MAWRRFVICLFGGFLGIHKFMEKKDRDGIFVPVYGGTVWNRMAVRLQ